jgi:hypothetical protein
MSKRRVKFIPFYCDWWHVFPGTVFDVVGLSNSHRSVYVDMRGRGVRLVPAEILKEVR